MIKLSSILYEDVTRKTIMKDAIETAEFFAKRAFTKQEAVNMAAAVVKRLHNYTLTPDDQETIKYHIVDHPNFR